MPQLDKFTYFSQFFWFCLFFFTFYIAIFNNGNGLLGISRILKLRNQLISNQGSKIQSGDADSSGDILRKGFSTGVSYMYSILFEVSQWCKTIDYLGKSLKFTLISFFGVIMGLFKIDTKILPLLSNFSYNMSSSRIPLRNEIMLIHVVHGQRSIVL
uniref:ATPase subunit 8 n=1 Tax=Rhynchospora tenuis TaxID=198213 RepID=UPI00223731E3|nr:ATPase subunit 8 [Rhynchospora tenuis]UYP50857.1 ATPase subunit 8 [Rhynchospora tenuis]